MNIVRISAGLGNQMFQYAFYRALRSNMPATKMDVSEFKYRKHHNGYELEKIFNIVPEYASEKEANQLADLSKNWFSQFRRKTLGIKLKTKGTLIDEGKTGTYYHPELLTIDNAYFQGFWQTEKYFAGIESQIRNEFTFKIPLDKQNREIADLIASSNAVSIHIRRGDYMKERRLHTTGSVCSLDYYRQAIDNISSKIENPSWFVFSDDISWVKENLKLSQAHYVDINTAENSYRDMQLMSLCHHNIIANSSFSWWGAYLNNHSDKIVIAPGIWFRGVDMPDIIPENWIKITIE